MRIGNHEHGVFYNGCTQYDIENSTRNGIHGEYIANCFYQSFSQKRGFFGVYVANMLKIVWVENGGVVGRGILLGMFTTPVPCFLFASHCGHVWLLCQITSTHIAIDRLCSLCRCKQYKL